MGIDIEKMPPLQCSTCDLLRTQLDEAKATNDVLSEHRQGLAADLVEQCDKVTTLQREVGQLNQWVDDLQGRMYINCVYCGHRYGPDDEEPKHETMREELHAHVEQCPKHPMAALKADNERLRKAAYIVKVAWESLPGGQSHPPKAVKHWLFEDMKPALDNLRTALAQPKPNDK